MIDWTKPILWDGKPARVQGPDLPGTYCKLIYIKQKDLLMRVDANGQDYGELQRVTNAPERVERWANMGAPSMHDFMWHESKCRADYNRGPACTSQLHGVFEGDKLISAEVVPLEGE